MHRVTRSRDGRRRGLLSVAEAARYLGVSPGTLRNWVSTRRVEFVKVGRLTVQRGGLDRYIAAHTVHAVGGPRMNLFKRCDSLGWPRCAHPYWFRFKLHRQRYRESTHTANRTLAERIAQKRRMACSRARPACAGRNPFVSRSTSRLTVRHTAKTNATAYKDQAVLDSLLASVGDRPIDEVSPFHIERWKQERAEDVSQSTVNRELNIIRGCFSRAVDWGRLRCRRCGRSSVQGGRSPCPRAE